MSVDDLVAALGVTKGSFYWHFAGRAEFVREVLEYWSREFTFDVGRRIQTDDDPDPVCRLRLLMQFLCEEEHARYDIAIRAWATQEEVVARILKKVDRFRMSTVRDLFRQMGFSNDELETRTRLFVVYHGFEYGLTPRLGKARREELIEPMLELLIA